MGTYSIRRMPPEIIREIFSHLFSLPLRASCPRDFPWYLGQICSQWRTLFFSMQSVFWREIEIDHSPFNDKIGSLGQRKSCERTDEIIIFFLNRTRGESFSFTLLEGTPYIWQQDYHVRWIVQVLLEHSRQWDQATIQLKWPEMRLLRAAKGHLPLLKKLNLSVPDDDLEDRPPAFLAGHASLISPDLTIFRDAPLLTEVSLRKIPDWQFNWSSLTMLDLDDIPKDDHTKIFNILRETVNLVVLWISDAFSLVTVNHEVSTKGLIQFPCLKCLYLHGMELLTALEVPALERLQVAFDSYDNGTQDASGMIAFLSRSRPRLETFVVTGAQGATIKEVLPYMSNIENLILREMRDLRSVFKWLAERPDPRMGCLTVLDGPKYQYSSIPRALVQREDLEALHDMIARRNPPGDVGNPSSQMLFLQTPDEGQGISERLKLLCRDKVQFVNAKEEGSNLSGYVNKFRPYVDSLTDKYSLALGRNPKCTSY